VNNSPGASDPLFFTHSAANLSSYDLVFWFKYEVVLFPVLQDGSAQQFFFLDSTDANGTYIVKWKTGGLTAPPTPSSGSLAGVSVSLQATTD
jgi:hypothetical protein